MADGSTLYYTRCPAPTATGVGAGLGTLQETLVAQGFQPRALQDIHDPAIRRHHFEHGIANLIREGGNIPAIWAKSGGARTRLLGITWLDEIQAVVVRPDSPARSVADLKGARFAVPVTPGHRLDVARISAVRGIEQALGTAGLQLSDATLVDVAHRSTAPGERGGEHFEDELAALATGDVDAVWLKSAAGAAAIASGKVRPLIRLDLADDPLVRVNNGTPRTLTFHEDFIAEHPDAVGAVLDAVRRAVETIGPDRHRLWALLAGETGQSVEDAESAFGGFTTANLLPDLTEERLAALQHQADFLFRHGFAPARVDVREWALPFPGAGA
ncbi:ABC transporter substrate-binding protein [Rhizobiaceae bacterium BDR2-2]|uniref:ABC transporter substrate-binding protein n=1 Tax=Ectorhizobium quercum TaxID=2965071 RepID=A0AAE3N2J8_9HYPH|nr:ABC transporter substrate-binding protein [Ectorhizobium quercum]MCX8997487.1 ABC transporter substrate-binding protein [Ectorhizobium quercum]